MDNSTVEEINEVVEMVRKDPSRIPERYIRSEEDRAKDVEKHAYSAEIPILDLSLLSNGDKEEHKKLDEACKDWGFFQVMMFLVSLCFTT